uniref:U-box domain-containing protein n=1 Tax=Scylla olivacea TaxID=85551 RepID=A0A0P4WFX5_SCYOL
METRRGRQLYGALLQRMKRGPDALVDGQHITLEEAFNKILEILSNGQFCACLVYEMVKVATKAIITKYKKNKVFAMKGLTHLGLLTLEVVSRQVSYDDATFTLRWQRVTFLAVSLASCWRPELYRQPAQQTRSLKYWTSMVMCRNNACPNPVLRIELLRFVAMWNLSDIMDVELGNNAIFGLMYNAIHIKARHLLPRRRVGMLSPLRSVLQQMHAAGLLGHLMLRSCSYMKRLVVGHVERSMTYLLVLMGNTARRVLWLCRKGDLTPVRSVEKLTDIMEILRLFVATQPNMELFEEPGLCQVAATTIARTCCCIVQIPDVPQASQALAKLVREMDSFFLTLIVFQKKGTIMGELQYHHARSLSFIDGKIKELQLAAFCLPESVAERQDVPERFLDSLTGRLMDTPLQLVFSGRVVDRCTLLLLKLATAVDESTGILMSDLRYVPLTDLKEEIRAWKEQHHRHPDGA